MLYVITFRLAPRTATATALETVSSLCCPMIPHSYARSPIGYPYLDCVRCAVCVRPFVLRALCSVHGVGAYIHTYCEAFPSEPSVTIE